MTILFALLLAAFIGVALYHSFIFSNPDDDNDPW